MMGLRKSAVRVVSDILETQHKALLAGDLGVLGRMAPDLERAFERLRRDGGTKSEVSHIKECAARNARLLAVARSGVAAAQAHLQSSRSTELTTYDVHGRSHVGVPAASQTLIRR